MVPAHPPVSLFKLDRQSLYFRGAMRTKKATGPILGLLLTFTPSAAAQDSAKSTKLTIEQLIEIKHPSNPAWSPDGRHVVFSWDRAGVANLYIANADGHGQPVAVTSFSEGQIEKAFWAGDSQTVYFPHDGHLWQAFFSGGAAKPPWTASGHASDFSLSARAQRGAFV